MNVCWIFAAASAADVQGKHFNWFMSHACTHLRNAIFYWISSFDMHVFLLDAIFRWSAFHVNAIYNSLAFSFFCSFVVISISLAPESLNIESLICSVQIKFGNCTYRSVTTVKRDTPCVCCVCTLYGMNTQNALCLRALLCQAYALKLCLKKMYAYKQIYSTLANVLCVSITFNWRLVFVGHNVNVTARYDAGGVIYYRNHQSQHTTPNPHRQHETLSASWNDKRMGPRRNIRIVSS